MSRPTPCCWSVPSDAPSLDGLATPAQTQAKAAAEELGIPERTARQYMRERMEHHYFGKHLRVSAQAFVTYQKQQKEQIQFVRM